MNDEKIGVINALNRGYEITLRAFWVMLIPIALDGFFWLGPRLSIEPLFGQLIALVADTASLGATYQQNVEEVRRALSEVGARFNLFGLLATDLVNRRVLPIPTLKAFEWSRPDATALQPLSPAITLSNVPLILGVAALLLIGGLLIGMAYMTLISEQLQNSQGTNKPLLRRIVKHWLQMLCFVACLLGIGFVSFVPFSLVVGLVSLVSTVVGTLMMLGAWLIVFWALLFLWFVAYAIISENTSFWRAMWHSAVIVQGNLLSTLGLILLGNIIVAGMGILWQQFEGYVWGQIVGIVGNAFIGSGLVAGSFVFYQNRYQLWQARRSRTQAANDR